MATPALDFLTGRAREALPFLRGAIARGLSNAEILALKGIEFASFARQRMLDVIAILRQSVPVRAGSPTLFQRYLRIVPPTTPLPIEAHAPSVTNLSSTYQYLVRADNLKTDEEFFITVSSAVPLSQVQINAVADTIFLGPTESGVGAAGRSQLATSIESAQFDSSRI